MSTLIAKLWMKVFDEEVHNMWRDVCNQHGHGPYRVHTERSIPSNAIYCMNCAGWFCPVPKEKEAA